MSEISHANTLDKECTQAVDHVYTDYILSLSDRNLVCPKPLLFRNTDRHNGWPIALIYDKKLKWWNVEIQGLCLTAMIYNCI